MRKPAFVGACLVAGLVAAASAGADPSTESLVPSGDGTVVGWASDGTPPLFDSVDDYLTGGAHDSDATYVLSPNAADGAAFFDLVDPSAGFDPAAVGEVTIRVAVRRASSPDAGGVDRVDLYARLFASDESSPLTGEAMVVAQPGTSYSEVTVPLPDPSHAGSKTEWDGVRLRLRQDWSQVDGRDGTARLRISAAETNLTWEDAEPPPPAVPGARFAAACPFSHRASDDPIVYPGVPGVAHSHDFFGATTTDAFSTAESLLAGPTTCRPNRTADHAGYWVPTLYKDGLAFDPSSVVVYYRHARKQPIETIPFGLQMIAGNQHAAGPQPQTIVSWVCRASGIPQGFNHPPTRDECDNGPEGGFREGFAMTIRFPDCWNGTDLHLPGEAHMAYSSVVDNVGTCPVTYPRKLPQLTVDAQYETFAPGISLSSGPHYTAHADFFNAWDPSVLADTIEFCLNPPNAQDCGTILP